MTTADEPNFPNCATEPIQFIGQTQSSGALILADSLDLSVDFCSQNLSEFLPIDSPETILEKPLKEILPAELFESLSQLEEEKLHFFPRIHSLPDIGAIVQKHGKKLFVEFESNPASEEDYTLNHQEHLSGMMDCSTEEELVECCLKGIDHILGMDRTMIYRFEPDKAGIVIAETNHNFEDNYLNLRFPASDIPDNARKLYLKTPLRLIYDIQTDPVPIIGKAGKQEKPDLTFSMSRAVAPVHCEYLKNMEVQSSLSLTVMIQDELWGLISCHKKTPLNISINRRKEAVLLIEGVSLKLRSLKAAASMRYLDRKSYYTKLLAKKLRAGLDSSIKEELWNELISIGAAKGIAIRTLGNWQTHGLTPADDQLDPFLKLIPQFIPFGQVATDCSSSLIPELENCADTASGVIAVWNHSMNVPTEDHLVILWFKPEVVQVVEWGGQPPSHTEELKLSPRKSFQKWKQEMYHHSEPWDKFAVFGTKGILLKLKEL